MDLLKANMGMVLVWGMVAGLVLVALPFSGPVRDAGLNLLLFFGVLFALRGMGVLVWFLAPGRVMTVVLFLFSVLFWPVVVIVSELARRSDRLGGFVAALPLVTVLTLVWLHVEKQPSARMPRPIANGMTATWLRRLVSTIRSGVSPATKSVWTMNCPPGAMM